MSLWFAVEELVALDGRRVPTDPGLRARFCRWVEVARFTDGAMAAAWCRRQADQADARRGRGWAREEECHRLVAVWPGLQGEEREEVEQQVVSPPAPAAPPLQPPVPPPTSPAPVIYLTNPGGLRGGKGGPGRAHLITISPPKWLLGITPRLVSMGTPPSTQMMKQARSGELSQTSYEAVCRTRWARLRDRLCPGRLMAVDARAWLGRNQFRHPQPVAEGDTLLCVCGAEAVCHRRWFAEELAAAGWRVVLDGQELVGGQAPPLSPKETKAKPSPSAPQLSLLAPPAPPPPSPSAPSPAQAPDPKIPLRPACWRVIEHGGTYLAGGYIDLLVTGSSEKDAWAVVCERVAATGRPWRLYRISPTGAWTPCGLPLYPWPLARASLALMLALAAGGLFAGVQPFRRAA